MVSAVSLFGRELSLSHSSALCGYSYSYRLLCAPAPPLLTALLTVLLAVSLAVLLAMPQATPLQCRDAVMSAAAWDARDKGQYNTLLGLRP